MIRRLGQQRAAKARDQRYGPDYNFGATYYDARNEAIRRGDRTIGTEHLVLALLIDPASPAARRSAATSTPPAGRSTHWTARRWPRSAYSRGSPPGRSRCARPGGCG